MGFPEADYVVDEVNNNIKNSLNSTLSTGYFNSLDILISAKLMCRGVAGTTFTITNYDYLTKPIVVTITDSSVLIDAQTNLRMEIVPVPLGSYCVKIELQDMTTTKNIEATDAGRPYYIAYTLSALLKRFTDNGAFTVPDIGNAHLLLTAAGAGGGGGSGGWGRSDYKEYNSGGGGGGGGAAVSLLYVNKSVGTKLNITVGAGGTGGVYSTSGFWYNSGFDGEAGGATIVEGVITLPGGKAGGGSDRSAGGTGGAPGGSGGGSGGAGGPYQGNGNAGHAGILGTGGKAGGVAGGGGGSIGNGGDGKAGVGVNGGGGSGGGDGAGGNGGKGIVEFYKGVVVL